MYYSLQSNIIEDLLVMTLIFSSVSSEESELNHISKTMDQPSEELKTGTVLFGNLFLETERCWIRRDIAELHARLQMQELLPPRRPKEVAFVYKYFKLCLQTVRSEVKNEYVQNIMLRVMADLFGGYQQAYGLPLMKRVSYEGNVDFLTVDNSLRMQEEFKNFLNTDGSGWLHPTIIKSTITPITKLELSTNDMDMPCQYVIMEDPRKYEEHIFRSEYSEIEKNLPISLPRFDNDIHPHAVVIPLKARNFCSLTTENGYNVLIDYYTRSVQCLKWLTIEWFSGHDESMMDNFDLCFRNWIIEKVIPLLDNEDWYPGFSGVLRILTTIQFRDSQKNHYVQKLLSHSVQNNQTDKVKSRAESRSDQSSQTQNSNKSNTNRILHRQINFIMISSMVLMVVIILLPIFVVTEENLMIFKQFFKRYSNRNPRKMITWSSDIGKGESIAISPVEREAESISDQRLNQDEYNIQTNSSDEQGSSSKNSNCVNSSETSGKISDGL